MVSEDSKDYLRYVLPNLACSRAAIRGSRRDAYYACAYGIASECFARPLDALYAFGSVPECPR